MIYIARPQVNPRSHLYSAQGPCIWFEVHRDSSCPGTHCGCLRTVVDTVESCQESIAGATGQCATGVSWKVVGLASLQLDSQELEWLSTSLVPRTQLCEESPASQGPLYRGRWAKPSERKTAGHCLSSAWRHWQQSRANQ